jgi:hypothetical protein
MAIEVIDRVWDLRLGLRAHPDKLVLVKLADNAHADGRGARPSVQTIARQCDLSERAAQNALRRLASVGVIAQERPATATSPTTYRIVLEMLPAKGERRQLFLERGGRCAPGAGDAPGAHGATRGVHAVRRGGARRAPKPSREPSIEPSSDTHGDRAPLGAVVRPDDDEADFSGVAGDQERAVTDRRVDEHRDIWT